MTTTQLFSRRAQRLAMCAIVAWSAISLIGCGGDDDVPPSPVGGFGASDAGGTGGVGADGGGGVGADGGGGMGADGGAGTSGSAGTMDASFDANLIDSSDDDGGALDAAGQGPPGWLCRGNLWNDGVCDCGCGLLDVDCNGGSCAEPGCTANACEACFGVNGGWIPCVAEIWLCDSTELDDANNFCDCGCGAPDPDCFGDGCTTASCRAQSCDRCHDDTHAVIGCEVPIEWQCDRGAYGGSDGCDCGCGAIDPDCNGGGCADGNCNDSACDVCRNSGLAPIPCGLPSGWLCSPLDFNSGDGCDCGCGAPDPDCAGAGCESNGCSDAACDSCHADSVAIACDVPSGWICHPAFYDNNDICNCGCGAPDPDCDGNACTTPDCTAAACDLCRASGGEFTQCDTWSCDEQHFGTGDGCDCGCGGSDPDCLIFPSCTTAGCDVDTCEQCNDNSGRHACGGWTCGLEKFGDGHCDCGCGAADPDCNGNGCTARGCSASACEQCRDSNGASVACEAGACDAAHLGSGDGCDCGCGTVDPDCAGLTACTAPGCSASECARCRDPRGRLINCL